MAAATDRQLEVVPPGRWVVDERATRVGFAVRHLAIATVRGRFASFSGWLDRDDGGAVGGGTVDVASLDTGEPIRDGRLTGPECFDAERHPIITLADARIEADEDGALRLRGDLTICGVTRPVALDVRLGKPRDPGVVALSLTGRIRRSDFGLRWSRVLEAGGAVVSDMVSIEIDVVLRRAAC